MMYFQIENTPEHIRRARRPQFEAQDLPKEDYPRLELAPFCRPPQVVFENVLIGTTSERILEVFNPSKQVQQITLGKALPPGLIVHLPGEWLELEPETCYCMTLRWTPTQPTSVRETIRFVNENRGRFDVIVVLKSTMNIKTKGSQSKVFKVSPGKVKKKASKKSPIVLYKTKSVTVHNTTKMNNSYKCVTQQKITKYSNKENVSIKDHPNTYNSDKCPFDSPSSLNLHFDISEIFSNKRKPDILQQTFDKSYTTNNSLNVPHNVLKPSNKQPCDSVAELIDNLTFTPLKYAPSKTEKLDLGPKIILSMNSDSDFDDSLDMKNDENKQNETHSIVSITSSQPPNKWVTVNHHTQVDCHCETPTVLVKKHPNTSSPKELNSPNFSINTEFSRISDLSFYPQRFSTERKCFPKLNNETQELLDEPMKLCSDTYTKDSPNTPSEPNIHQMYDARPPHFFMKEQPKICRQALFKEYHTQKEIFSQNSYLNPYEHNVWQNDLRTDTRSPPRSITPPLQSIPEESVQFSDTQILDKTDRCRNTFTVDQTFDKTRDNFTNRQSWSKKALRAQPDLWKVPITHIKKSVKNRQSKGKDSIGGKISNKTFEMNKSGIQNMSINLIGNVYSQSSTIDPFVSSTYFYDEEAVEKFETEFKRWLNCILTPPADLDSNIEQTIDVGKAWIATRNKDVPIAPTKEQVSSAYHNSHRLERVRRSARTLLISPEITQVFQKLTLQIEKKLIAVRTDRNLHLDVGLQKIIMELLLSYNPLWLRIGLEAIYGIALPLKSNSDIEGLTTFIIQRMFKNPFLRNKHSKSNAPNMLLPAYMDAIKKFTLKKFFMLVYFLDQAKQKKLISHDPCLFCRNAVCKESREIIIRFTREVIAGIGDITKHLRPLGYVVSHKQSYLDEYKYAVHNLALDLRDGVRLTKVMEIILMKDGLLGQLRTPAISRLQKIHNVHVALNALKNANFIIHGDITSTDIADGHREKTLSLLWQIIHVFRAPLFEQAANVIQTWWRKKYEVIIEKRKEAEKILQERNNAASLIQCWWRRIQYDRWAEWQMQQVTTSVIIIQKYCRKWLCRARLLKWKKSVSIIEEWYRSTKMIREAKMTLDSLRVEQHALRTRSAIVIQSYVRRWLCMKMYATQLKKIILIQSVIRRYLCRKKYLQYRQTIVYVQRKYKAKLLMKTEMQHYIKQRKYAIVTQSYFRMIKHRREYINIKNSVRIIEERYKALLYMRKERKNYLELRQKVIKIQTLFRRYKCVEKYLRQRELIIYIQRRIKSNQLTKKQRCEFLRLRNAAVIIQKYIRAYIEMKHVRQDYITLQKSTIIIQRYFRSYLLKKMQRKQFVSLRSATIVLQKSYRSLILMRKERTVFLNLKRCSINIQRRYRGKILMKKQCEEYRQLMKATLTIQRKYRAYRNMRLQRTAYLNMKSSCIVIQRAYRAFVAGRCQRQDFLRKKQAANKIQIWFRTCKRGKEIKQQFQTLKHACVIIQRIYKAHIIGRKQKQEYSRIRTATVIIQQYYRSYIETKIVRQQYVKLKTATVIIQRYYRSHLEMKEQRKSYLEMKNAALLISRYYKCYRETRILRDRYYQLRKASILIQRWYRSICAMRVERNKFLKTKAMVTFVQKKYKALLAMRNMRRSYLRLRQSVIIIQTRFRAYRLMKQTRINYIIKLRACRSIQRYYRSYVLCQRQRTEYMKLKQTAVVVQRRFRALVNMRSERKTYLALRAATIVVQRRYRSRCLMLKVKESYIKMLNSSITIQRAYRAYTCGKRVRQEYIKIQTAVKIIQREYRMFKEKRKIQSEYQQLRRAAILVQRKYRANKISRAIKLNGAARKIQTWYRATKKCNICRQEYLTLRKTIILTQSIVRMRIVRRKFLTIKNAALCIQKYYRDYKLMLSGKHRYIRTRDAVIKLQSYIRRYIARKRFCKLRSIALIIQATYRFKKEQKIKYQRERIAAICLQKYIRRHVVRSRYLQLKQKVIYIQRIWRGKLTTRLVRCEFLQKRNIIIKFQSIIRGYLLRKNIQAKRVYIEKVREEKIRHYAASRIQALYRGHVVRMHVAHDKRITELRHRWRNGGLKSTQESMKERNEEAMEVLGTVSDIETVIKAFRSLELLTEVFPMRYKENALEIVQQVYAYMSTTNRSISSLELLKFAAAVLVNFARYSATGQEIYSRDHIQPILKFMLRFSKTEIHVFCIMATYLWLFSKYENVKKDLTAFLNLPENHKILVNIKISVDKTKRMTTNILKNKFSTPKPCKFVSNIKNQSLNISVCTGNTSIILPNLEPDYGIVRVDKPRYFEDAQQAINCLFLTYKL